MRSHLFMLTMIVTLVITMGLVYESQGFDDLDQDRGRGEISIVSPGGGDTLEGGSEQKISWQISGSIQYVKIEYSLNKAEMARDRQERESHSTSAVIPVASAMHTHYQGKGPYIRCLWGRLQCEFQNLYNTL